MTGNLIACIVILSLGLLAAGIAIYNFIKLVHNLDEDYRIIPATLFTIFSFIFILSSLVHWNDDKEFKTIKCKEYNVETVVNYSRGSSDTTYIIYYKQKQ